MSSSDSNNNNTASAVRSVSMPPPPVVVTGTTTPIAAKSQVQAQAAILNRTTASLKNDPPPPATIWEELRGSVTTFVSGGIAGAISRTFTAPLDRVKVLVQEGHNLHKMIQPKNPDLAVERSSYRRLPRCEVPSVREVLQYIHTEEGMKGFWRGNGVNCMKAGPEFALVFTVRRMLSRRVEDRKSYEAEGTFQPPWRGLLLSNNISTTTAVSSSQPATSAALPSSSSSSSLLVGGGVPTEDAVTMAAITGIGSAEGCGSGGARAVVDLSALSSLPSPPQLPSEWFARKHSPKRWDQILLAAYTTHSNLSGVATAATTTTNTTESPPVGGVVNPAAAITCASVLTMVTSMPDSQVPDCPFGAASVDTRAAVDKQQTQQSEALHHHRHRTLLETVAAFTTGTTTTTGATAAPTTTTALLSSTASAAHPLQQQQQNASVLIAVPAATGQMYHYYYWVPVSAAPTLLINFVIGSIAGATAQVTLYPLELIKTRLAVAKKGEFSGGLFECVRYTYRNGGIREFYKGLTPNLCGIIPYRGLEVGIFYTVQSKMLARRHEYRGKSAKHLSMYETAIIGTLASIVAQTATYPLNVVRTRLQTQGVNNRPKMYNGMGDCFAHIMRKDGVPGLFRGLTANYLKAVPASALTFTVFEEMQKIFGQ